MSNETLIDLWESMPQTASTMWCRNYQTWTFSVTDNGLTQWFKIHRLEI